MRNDEDGLEALLHKRSNQLCAASGEGAGSLAEKITKLFTELPDPLLSQAEIKSLLRTADSDEDYILTLDRLCQDEFSPHQRAASNDSSTTRAPINSVLRRTRDRLYEGIVSFPRIKPSPADMIQKSERPA